MGLGLTLAAAMVTAGAGCESDSEGGAGGHAGGGNGGARWSHLIRSDGYPRLVFEIDAVPGQEPSPATEQALTQGLFHVVDKPGGIDAIEDEPIESPGEDHAWGTSELHALADRTANLQVPDDTITIHTLFIDGHSDADTNFVEVLGLAWGYQHIVLFQQTIARHCAASTLPELLQQEQCDAAELAIWTHETGHVLGLVDNGLPMVADHRDPDRAHGPHDASDQCVMYWAYQGTALFDVIGQRLLNGQPADLGFGPECLEDIAAERDR